LERACCWLSRRRRAGASATRTWCTSTTTMTATITTTTTTTTTITTTTTTDSVRSDADDGPFDRRQVRSSLRDGRTDSRRRRFSSYMRASASESSHPSVDGLPGSNSETPELRERWKADDGDPLYSARASRSRTASPGLLVAVASVARGRRTHPLRGVPPRRMSGRPSGANCPI